MAGAVAQVSVIDAFVASVLDHARAAGICFDVLGGFSGGHIDLASSSDVDIMCRSAADAAQLGRLIRGQLRAYTSVRVVQRRDSEGGFQQWVLAHDATLFMLDLLVGFRYGNFLLLDPEVYFEMKEAGLDAPAVARFIKRQTGFRQSWPHPPKRIYSLRAGPPGRLPRLGHYARGAWPILRSWFGRRRGCFVAVLGPDGCGKTTVIDSVVRAFFGQRSLLRTDVFHWRPQYRRSASEVAVDPDPHGKTRRGLLSSVAKLGYLVIMYQAGYWMRLHRLLQRGVVIIFDRYYHDMLVDARRYRYGGPQWLAAAAARLIPQPDLWILLDAPAAVMHARKPEVSLAETERQREAYLGFIAAEEGRVVDATQPPGEVARTVQQLILDCLSERTAEALH